MSGEEDFGGDDFIDDNEYFDNDDGFEPDDFDEDGDFQELDGDWILSNSGNDLRGSLNGSGQWMSVEPNKVEYVCLTPDMILKRQHEALQQVQVILSHLPLSFARILLQRFKWDAMKMIGLYTDNPDKVCKEAGLPPPSEMIDVSTRCENEYCLICFEEKDLIKVPCGHAFCVQCWREYLSIEVKERKVIIQCCGSSGKEKCAMVVDEFTVLSLLDSEESKEIFKDALTKSFVEDNPDCKWCPSPGCQNAIMLLERNGESNEAVVCKCGHCFCYRCLQEDHRPCSCAMVAKWKVLHGGEDTSLDEGWVACFSRPCPKCNIPIQKNQGCNHMTCPKCSFHFCWTCMEKFGSGPMGGTDGYSTHKCNGTYMEDSAKRDKVAEIERYQHYSERFDAHMNSAKLEKKLLLLNEEKISAITKCEGFLGNDFSDAMHQILQNRVALKYSYAFGYYRAQYAEYVNKNIFENLQLDLERHTELLSNIGSKFVEIAIKKSDFGQNSQFVQTRQEMVDQRRIAKKVLDALFDASSHWSLMEMESKEIVNPSFVNNTQPSEITIDIADNTNNNNNTNNNINNTNNNNGTVSNNNPTDNNNNNTPVNVDNNNNNNGNNNTAGNGQSFTTTVPQNDPNNNSKKKRSGLMKFFGKKN